MAGRYDGLTRAARRVPKGMFWAFHLWAFGLFGERWGLWGTSARGMRCKPSRNRYLEISIQTEGGGAWLVMLDDE